MAIGGEQIKPDTIESAKFTPAARAEFGGGGAAVTKSADYDITSNDNGQTFLVNTSSIRGTLVASLAEGFECKVITVSSASAILVEPPAGETITVPPGLGWATAGTGSAAQALQFTGSVWLKKTGTTWLVIGIAGSSVSFESVVGPFANALGFQLAQAQQYLRSDPAATFPTDTSTIVLSFFIKNSKLGDVTTDVEPVVLNQWREDGGSGAITRWKVTIHNPVGTTQTIRATFWESAGRIWDYYIDVTNNINDGDWHHVLIVFDPALQGHTNTRFFFDSNEYAPTDAGSVGTPNLITTATPPLDIGARLTNTGGTPGWSGSDHQNEVEMDEIAIWWQRPGSISAPIDYIVFAGEIAGMPPSTVPLAVNLNALSGGAQDYPQEWWRFETTDQGQFVPAGTILQNGDDGLDDIQQSHSLLVNAGPNYSDGPSV